MKRNGFTLVELMIAVALMLLVMVGVGMIFKTAGQATGQGQIVSEITRNAQAAQTVMTGDFNGVSPDSPYILIKSETQPAFRNQQDQASSPDPTNPLIDTDPSGTSVTRVNNIPSITYTPATINYRNHRIDKLAFFSRGQFARQTGNDGALEARQSSGESLVWYGHLWLPDNFGNYPAPTSLANASTTFPGQGTQSTNPNNFYATQWVLGRFGILLTEPTGTTPDQITDTSGVAQRHLSIVASTVSIPLAPLEAGSLPDKNDTTTTQAQAHLEMSRYDLAATSMSGFQTILKNYIQNNAAGTNWWDNLMLADVQQVNGGFIGGRFQAQPFLTKPLTSAGYAKQAPILLPGCTHFIVEYAGDFLTQNGDPTNANYGQVTDTCYDTTTLPSPTRHPTDGVIDFSVIGTPPNATTQIRWYGFPRDTSGDGKVTSTFSSTDSVPLRDVWRQLPRESSSKAPFEQFTTSTVANTLPIQANYMTTGAMTNGELYTCAWGPNDQVRPLLIRITAVVDDPSGRLADGLSFQYVFKIQ